MCSGGRRVGFKIIIISQLLVSTYDKILIVGLVIIVPCAMYDSHDNLHSIYPSSQENIIIAKALIKAQVVNRDTFW